MSVPRTCWFYPEATLPTGNAQCLYCDDTINYGSRGFLALVEHATKGKKHAEKDALRRTNYSLGSAFVVEIPTARVDVFCRFQRR